MKIDKKLIFSVFAVLIFVGLFFLNVYQGYKYERLQTRIDMFEEEQKKWFEENKKMLATLSVFSSPERIKQISDSMGLKNSSAGQNIIIEIKGQEHLNGEKEE